MYVRNANDKTCVPTNTVYIQLQYYYQEWISIIEELDTSPQTYRAVRGMLGTK